MKIVKISLVLGLILVALVAFIPDRGIAMSGIQSGWAPDKRVPGYLDDTFTPFLVADRNRTVHAFATQWVGDGEERRRAIVYRQWTVAGGWTRPNDILLSPTWDAQILGMFLASDGVFHLIFWGSAAEGDTPAIYYSSALATYAENASAWSYPELIGEGAFTPSSGVIEGDSQGNLVVIFNGNKDGNGIYIAISNDTGRSWSDSVPLLLTDDSNTIPYKIKSFVGPSGRMHLVWSVYVLEGGMPDSLYYVGIDLQTGKWLRPILLDKRPDIVGYWGPQVPAVVDNGQYVVIMYNGGNPFTGGTVPVGRPTLLVRLSKDGGQTWGNVTSPLPFLTGWSDEQILVVDSNQIVHLIAIMRIDQIVDGEYQSVGGVWHSRFKDGVWIYPDRFVPTIAPSTLRAVVSQGNIILVTWTADIVIGGKEGVWYSYTVLDSPELPISPFSIPSTLENSANIAAPATSTESIPLPTATSELPLLWNEVSYLSNPQISMLFGIFPVTLLLVLIVLWVLYSRRK